MNFIIKTFSELSTSELYQILQLRAAVFVVEQNCVYQDIDFKDQKALHIFAHKENEIIAYSRIFKPGDYFSNASIGRVVIKKSERNFGYGHLLMSTSIKAIKSKFNQNTITISAQQYLTNFYESHLFKQVGESYLEDGIPHIKMIREKDA